ncbi:hypothetical protein PsYK624_063230 [Phanerochaete sordida]|uniref:Uncharacterized protein n=1 Tax=Phanerochaete sordida TaxID=48140 RepID=A0A9P3G8V0_9APHY|nr:hypothetical protein PsYK624_063230 [Phanerochaete sordida]
MPERGQRIFRSSSPSLSSGWRSELRLASAATLAPARRQTALSRQWHPFALWCEAQPGSARAEVSEPAEEGDIGTSVLGHAFREDFTWDELSHERERCSSSANVSSRTARLSSADLTARSANSEGSRAGGPLSQQY